MNEADAAHTKKLDAARRQLLTAIWLWFNEGDLVSVSTLAGAAHIVLDDLQHHKDRGRAMPFERIPEGMKAEEWTRIIKEAQDFAKHARRDPGNAYLYTVESTGIYLYFVASSYVRFTDYTDTGGLPGLFAVYFAIRNPSCFLLDVLPTINKTLNVERAKNLSRIEFLKQVSADTGTNYCLIPRFHSGSLPE
jgi:hypothetical protein